MEYRQDMNFIVMNAIVDDVRKTLDLCSPHLAKLGRVTFWMKSEATELRLDLVHKLIP
jgi:hypothetical protein